MISATYASADIRVLPYGPDWSRRVDMNLSVPLDRDRGQTGREARRAFGHTLRCEFEWRTRLARDRANTLRAALETLADKPVVTPAWPFAMPAAGWPFAPVSGGLVIAWRRDWTDWTLTTPGVLSGTWDFVAPAVWGFVEAEMDDLDGTDAINVRFRFEEDGPAAYSLTPAAQSWPVGPALSDASTPPVFPFRIDWSERPRPGLPRVSMDREKRGPARSSAVTFYPQIAERPQEGSVTLTDRGQVARFLRWWMDRHGSAESHLVTTLSGVTALAADATAGATTLTVTNAAALGTHRLLELATHDATAVVQVTGISGDTLTLAAPLARNWLVVRTRVALVMLARHAKSEVGLRFTAPGIADLRTAWIEVPAEVDPDGDTETRGETLGALSVTAYLYQITEDYGGGVTTVHRCTSFERDVTAGSQTWTSRPGLDHGEIRRTLKLDRDETTIKGRWWTGCPFEQFLPGKLSALVRVAIYESEVDADGAGSTPVQLFGGEVTKCPFEGPNFSASAAGMYSLFDRPAFACRAQKTCNATVFSAFCGLALADWTFDASTVSASGTSLVLDTFTRTGGLPAGFGFANWFALGYAQRTVADKPQRYLILTSTPLASGQITLALDRAVSPMPAADDAWTVVPGCDGRAATCKTYHASNNTAGKFSHFADFKGFDELPDKDPAFQPLKKSDSAAGKK